MSKDPNVKNLLIPKMLEVGFSKKNTKDSNLVNLIMNGVYDLMKHETTSIELAVARVVTESWGMIKGVTRFRKDALDVLEPFMEEKK